VLYHSRVLSLLLLLSFGQNLVAEVSDQPELIIPLECEIGKDCDIQNYMDHKPGVGFQDYQCGGLGYDGHKGTDFRLPNLKWMREGVQVVASADGRVRAIRDEMPDISGQLKSIEGKEAGNSVAVMHGNGWETQYSHLRLGSVTVKPGQEVKAGQALGLVGLSGKTEFPLVHLAVRQRGKPVDT